MPSGVASFRRYPLPCPLLALMINSLTRLIPKMRRVFLCGGVVEELRRSCGSVCLLSVLLLFGFAFFCFLFAVLAAGVAAALALGGGFPLFVVSVGKDVLAQEFLHDGLAVALLAGVVLAAGDAFVAVDDVARYGCGDAEGVAGCGYGSHCGTNGAGGAL